MPNGSTPIILTTTNFQSLFNEVYNTIYPGGRTTITGVGKVLVVGSDGKITATNTITLTPSALSIIKETNGTTATVSLEQYIDGKIPADVANVASLSARVDAAESSITSINTQLGQKVNSEDFTRLSGSVNAQATSITSLSTSVNDLAANTKLTLEGNDKSSLVNMLGFQLGSTIVNNETVTILKAQDGSALTKTGALGENYANMHDYIDSNIASLNTNLTNANVGTSSAASSTTGNLWARVLDLQARMTSLEDKLTSARPNGQLIIDDFTTE